MNFWQNTSLDIVVNPAVLTRARLKWQDWMPVNLNKMLDKKYKNNKKVHRLLQQVDEKVSIVSKSKYCVWENKTKSLIWPWIVHPYYLGARLIGPADAHLRSGCMIVEMPGESIEKQ